MFSHHVNIILKRPPGDPHALQFTKDIIDGPHGTLDVEKVPHI